MAHLLARYRLDTDRSVDCTAPDHQLGLTLSTIHGLLVELPYQYPPELLQLLIDTIPLLCRSKQDVLTFLRGAGIPPELMADVTKQVREDRGSITKFDIVRRVLTVPPQLKCDSTPLQLWSTEESNESREEPREAPPVYS